MGRQLGRLDIAADAATTLARVDERAGDPDSSRRALVDAIVEARSSGSVASELRSLFILGGLNYELGRVSEALEIYQQAWKRAGEAGVPWGPWGLEARVMTGILALVGGEWELADDTVDTTGESPPELAEALLAAVGMEVAAGLGDVGALQSLDRLRPWWQRDGFVAILSGAAAIELLGHGGDLDARHGGARRCRRWRLRALAPARLAGPHPAEHAAAGPPLVVGEPCDRPGAVRPGASRRRARRLDRRRGRRWHLPWAAARSGGRGLAGAGSSRACPAALAVRGRRRLRGVAARDLAPGGAGVRDVRPRLRDGAVTRSARGGAPGDRRHGGSDGGDRARP